MKLQPLGNYVILKQADPEETTASGIILPGQTAEKPQYATVIAIGPDVDNVSVDDKVIYSKYAGTQVEIEKETCIVIKNNDILAIINN